jgi:hypothetical protein
MLAGVRDACLDWATGRATQCHPGQTHCRLDPMTDEPRTSDGAHELFGGFRPLYRPKPYTLAAIPFNLTFSSHLYRRADENRRNGRKNLPAYFYRKHMALSSGSGSASAA